MARLLEALDADWRSLEHAAAGRRALRRWAAEDPRYAVFEDLAELRHYFERRDIRHDRDSLMADLLRRSPDDATARRVLLAALRPGLVRLMQKAERFWDRDDAESIVVTSALERLADRRPLPANTAAAILGTVQYAIWARRSHERMYDDRWGQRDHPDLLDHVEDDDHAATRTRLLQLLTEAVRRGAVPAEGARLVILHWIHGYTNTEIAEHDGLRPCTIRKHRRDAEQRLAAFAGPEAA